MDNTSQEKSFVDLGLDALEDEGRDAVDPRSNIFADLERREAYDYLTYVLCENYAVYLLIKELVEGDNWTIEKLANANGYPVDVLGTIVQSAWDGFVRFRSEQGLPVVGQCPHELPGSIS